MRDESHLDDMRTAIRGDFERLARRRGNQELMRLDHDSTEVGDVDGTFDQPEREPPPASVPTHDISGALTFPELDERQVLAPASDEPEELPDLVPDPGPGAEAIPVKHRSWLDRLLGRD